MPAWAVVVGYLLNSNWSPLLSGVLMFAIFVAIGALARGVDAGLVGTAAMLAITFVALLYIFRWRSSADWQDLHRKLQAREFGPPRSSD